MDLSNFSYSHIYWIFSVSLNNSTVKNIIYGGKHYA